ncbi:MAG: secretin N-terminal domain-containing protein, partial [Nitrospiria bacterium]
MKLNRQRIIGVSLVGMVLLGCAASREVRLADQFGTQGNWDGAVFLYQEAVQKDPKNLSLRRKLDEAKGKAAEQHYQRGRDLLKEKNLPQALDEFKRAMALDPAKQEHRAALKEALKLKEAGDLYATGLKLMRAERLSDALKQFEDALDLDPTLVAAQEMIRKLTEDQKAGRGGEAELTLKSTQPITLKFQNAKLNEVFEFLSKATGINILFDKDVRPETLTVTIFVKNASFKEALNLIMATNNLFMKKISEDMILIIPKTKQKVDQYQDLMIRTFYLSSTKAEDMVNLLRTMLETRRVYVNKELNAVVLRDTPEKIKLAEKIIEANDRMVAEVMFNVEVLEVDQSNQLKYGWRLSNNSIEARVGDSGATGPQAAISLDTLRSGYTWFFVLPTVIVDFLKTEGQAKTLANPRIRVLDNKQAKVNIGDKIPILLSTTTTALPSGTQALQTTSTSTNVEYKDTGIKVTIKPKVDLSNDVNLELSLEVVNLGELVPLGNGTFQFKFGNRSADTTLKVRDGETVVIGGLVGDEDRVSSTKIPGLGDIPFLGKLFSSIDKTKRTTDLIMTITPTVVRGLETPDKDLQYFWSGTEETYSTRPLFSELLTTGEVRREESPAFTPGSNAPVPGPPFIPPSLVPPGPVPPAPEIPTPSTILPRRSSQPNPATKPPATVVLYPQEARVSVSQEVTVGVMVNNAAELSEAVLSLAYNPALLEFRRATEGDLMGRDGLSTSFVSSTNPSTGLVDVRIKRLADKRGINGSGTLFSL